MTDARDTQKVKSLPDDLRKVAEDMLADKFGYAKEGEVQEKQKKEHNGVWESIGDWTTVASTATSTLSIEDIRRAVDSIRDNTGDYGMSPEQWARMAEKGYERNELPYIPDISCFELQLESPYTRRKYVHRFSKYDLMDCKDLKIITYVVAKIVDHVSREHMEPFIIVDPQTIRRHREDYFTRYVNNAPFSY